MSSLTYSPSNQLLVQGIKDNDGNVIYKTIGNAVNIIVETTRGKVPIFVFGKSGPVEVSRGYRFIQGTMDMVLIDKTFEEMFGTQKDYYVTEIEKNLSNNVTNQSITKSFFGLDVSAYKKSEKYVDEIKFDELLLISYNSDATVSVKDGKLSILQVVLYDVEFVDYSYAKRVSDVTQLERVSFMARRMSPVHLKSANQ